MSKKLRGCLTILAVFIVGVIVIYYGARWAYYQGWWGKSSPVARYLWLCDAPPEFEQTLYPEGMEILLPACKNLLSDQWYHRLVFFSSDRQYVAIRGDQEYDWIDLDTGNITVTQPLSVTLEECITDKIVEVVSLDGRRIAKQDGIYDVQSGEKLLNYGLEEHELTVCPSLDVFYPCAWLPENRGIILVPGSPPWGLELLALDGCYGEHLIRSNYPVPQPVLKFNVPEAYR